MKERLLENHVLKGHQIIKNNNKKRKRRKGRKRQFQLLSSIHEFTRETDVGNQLSLLPCLLSCGCAESLLPSLFLGQTRDPSSSKLLVLHSFTHKTHEILECTKTGDIREFHIFKKQKQN